MTSIFDLPGGLWVVSMWAVIPLGVGLAAVRWFEVALFRGDRDVDD